MDLRSRIRNVLNSDGAAAVWVYGDSYHLGCQPKNRFEPLRASSLPQHCCCGCGRSFCALVREENKTQDDNSCLPQDYGNGTHGLYLRVVIDQNLYYIGVQLTSASFAAALIKIPAIPFFMALFSVAGALMMIFYKGPIIEFIWSKGGSYTDGANEGANWLMGTLALLASAVCFSGFIFLQSNTLKSYPANLSLTTLICLLGTLMSTVVALITEHGKVDAWIIGWDSRLFAAVYSGILCTGVAYYVQGVVMKERDAVFVTAFNPLCMIIVVFLGSIILAEVVTLGSLLGITIIVIGLYFFIWGKSKDHVNPNSNTNTKEALELPKTKNIGDGNLASVGDVIVVVDIATTISEDNLNEAGDCESINFTSLVVEIPEVQTS